MIATFAFLVAFLFVGLIAFIRRPSRSVDSLFGFR